MPAPISSDEFMSDAKRIDLLVEALEGILAVGSGDFNGTEMDCYCGSVEGEDGDLDENATCWVCKARAAIARAKV